MRSSHVAPTAEPPATISTVDVTTTIMDSPTMTHGTRRAATLRWDLPAGTGVSISVRILAVR